MWVFGYIITKSEYNKFKNHYSIQLCLAQSVVGTCNSYSEVTMHDNKTRKFVVFAIAKAVQTILNNATE